LILGVGVGSLREEFELLGADFDDRGERADDAMRALRAALSQSEPAYDGKFYSFSGMLVDPCAVQSHVPLWVGGRTFRSLRRAVEIGDGWAPFGLRTAELAEMLARVEVPDGFDIVLQASTSFCRTSIPSIR
jgi:alkanesulfonate monooxygenase SsuD/methylene tetrahydromethanopterin reductase-like flavin-dependent oxidoreductase (luciferase family)